MAAFLSQLQMWLLQFHKCAAMQGYFPHNHGSAYRKKKKKQLTASWWFLKSPEREMSGGGLGGICLWKRKKKRKVCRDWEKVFKGTEVWGLGVREWQKQRKKGRKRGRHQSADRLSVGCGWRWSRHGVRVEAGDESKGRCVFVCIRDAVGRAQSLQCTHFISPSALPPTQPENITKPFVTLLWARLHRTSRFDLQLWTTCGKTCITGEERKKTSHDITCTHFRVNNFGLNHVISCLCHKFWRLVFWNTCWMFYADL